jgi:hypothetical protein
MSPPLLDCTTDEQRSVIRLFVEMVPKLKFKLLLHEPHHLVSPPFDPHSFGPVRKRYVDADFQEVKEAVRTWLQEELANILVRRHQEAAGPM